MSIISVLNSIIGKANETTKKSDTNLTDAVQHLVDGYGGGGSTDIPFPFGGMNAELVAEYEEEFSLADTSFVIGESASTSSTAILASVAQRFNTPTIAYGDKDVVAVQYVNTEVEHEPTASNQSRQIKSAYVMTTFSSKRKTSDASMKTTRQILSIANANMIKYLNTSGVLSRTLLSSSYGFYGTPLAPTWSSATAASTVLRFASPTLYYRVSSTYESSTNIKLVKDVKWTWGVKVYTVDSMSTPVAAVNDMQDAFLTDGASAAAMPMMMSLDYDDEEVEEE